MKENTQTDRGGILLYKNRLEKETVWLTQLQIADLFGTQRPAITKHLSNIFKTKELNRDSVSSKKEHTAADGKIYQTQCVSMKTHWSL